MSSSISNSNNRLPKAKWGQIWFIVFILMGVSICVWDYYWYQRGDYLLTKDRTELWSYHRGRIEGDRNIVLIGTSRMLAGIDQKTIQEQTNKLPVQLAIGGNSPLLVLQNLAEDESFTGTVISDFEELAIYPQEVFKHNPNKDIPVFNAEESVNKYKESSISSIIEFRLRLLGEYIIASPTLGNNTADILNNLFFVGIPRRSILENALKGEVRVYFNRTLPFKADEMSEETLSNLKEMQRIGFTKQIDNISPNPETFFEIINKIEGFVKRIQARGGKVFFVSFPKNGEMWEINERGYPRKTFWDVFAAKTSAKTIHFKDYPQLQFECPDGSHLGSRDAPAFTKALMEIIFENKE